MKVFFLLRSASITEDQLVQVIMPPVITIWSFVRLLFTPLLNESLLKIMKSKLQYLNNRRNGVRQSLTFKASGVCLFKVKNIAYLVNTKGSKFFYSCEMESAKRCLSGRCQSSNFYTRQSNMYLLCIKKAIIKGSNTLYQKEASPHPK